VASEGAHWRLFLDTGVIIAGCTLPWGAAKAVLILATQRRRFTVVMAEPVERELSRVLARREVAVSEAIAGWLRLARQERWRWPGPRSCRCCGMRATLLPW
jgi:hypothetical protein